MILSGSVWIASKGNTVNNFYLTPWYLRLLGYKKYRRIENVPVVFGIYGHTPKWVYYKSIEGVK